MDLMKSRKKKQICKHIRFLLIDYTHSPQEEDHIVAIGMTLRHILSSPNEQLKNGNSQQIHHFSQNTRAVTTRQITAMGIIAEKRKAPRCQVMW